MFKKASKINGTPRVDKVSDWENQEKKLTCDLKPGEITNFING